jgi:hypothetical protein
MRHDGWIVPVTFLLGLALYALGLRYLWRM